MFSYQSCVEVLNIRLPAVREPRVKIMLVRIDHEVGRQAMLQLPCRLVALQVNVLVLHGPPQPLDEHVVQGPAAAIHTDRDPRSLQHARERSAGELRPLIGVEDLRLPLRQRRLQRADAEAAVERVG